MKVALCLLTRNEHPCLTKVFPLIPSASKESGFDEIVAIDAGSTDGTVEFFQRNNVPIVRQTRPGRGAAFLDAFQKVDADALIFFSPDGNEDPADLPKFRQFIEQGADLVIASRMMKGAVNEEDAQLLRFRKWANKFFNFFANLVFRKGGSYITDSINGYRAITKQAARELSLDALDYTIEYQMTMRALDANLRIVEFPTTEGQRVAGETGAASLPTGIRFIKRFIAEWKRKRSR